MFWPDVLSYKAFYSSPLGRMTCRIIRRQLRALWGEEMDGQAVLGLGYAIPYLTIFDGQAARVLAGMPSMQGSVQWPNGHPNRSFLTDEADIPLPSDSMDRILMVHMLEHSHAPHYVMQEIWRILSPEGRLIVLTPHRRGFWASSDATPMGHGRPYSERQLRDLLTEHKLAPVHCEKRLFFPPSNNRLILRSANSLEWVGEHCLPFFGGMLCMEAEKQIYAIRPQGRGVRIRSPLPVTASEPAVGLHPHYQK